MRLGDSHNGNGDPHADARERRAQRRRERKARAEAAPPPPPLSETIQIVTAEVQKAAGHLKVLGTVQADRAKLRARHYLSRLSTNALIWLITATLLVSGAVLFARGTARFLDALFGGRPGVADLVTGGGLLIGLTLWLLIRSAQRKKRELEVYRAKYARLEHETAARSGGQIEAPGDAGAAPRP